MISVLAALLLSQCATGITDNAQSLCGVKSFPQGAIVGVNGGDYPGLVVRGGGVWLDGVYSGVQVVPGGGAPVYMRDDVPIGSLAPSFLFETRRARELTDPVLVVRRAGANGGGPVVLFTLFGDGTIITNTVKTTGHSGDPSLQAIKNYVGVSADFPPNYQGEHGALSVSGGTKCVGYNLIQASNARTGSRSDYAFNVSCRGGLYSRDMITSSELPVCNNGLPEPPEPNNRYGGCTGLANPSAPPCNFGACGALLDGGYCHDWTTFYATSDAGYAKAGETFGFVADVGEGCQCVPAKYDGGASPAGWFKLSDRSECRP